MFFITGVNDKFWNQDKFIEYLVANQHRQIELSIVSEAIDLKNLGVYRLLDLFEFERVIINTWNPLEKHDLYEIKSVNPAFWFTKTANVDVNLHEWTQEKLFMCLYHRPSAGRLALAGHLQHNYTDQSVIHFSIDTDIDSLINFEFDKLLSYDIDSVAPAANLLKSLPILQYSRERHTTSDGYDYADPLTALYKNILVDIVGETHVLGRTFFPTEKTTRPMLLKKPFITFASRHYMSYLRQMGFKTFHQFWNEDYDSYETRGRLLKIYQLLQDIAARPKSELYKMYNEMQSILDHNYNLLMTQTYNKTVIELS